MQRNIHTETDRLLSQASRSPDAPFYTDVGFQRKLERIKNRETSFASINLLYLPRAERKRIQKTEIEQAISQAKLSTKQKQIVLDRLCGMTWREIGRNHGNSKQNAAKIFQRAMKRVRHALTTNPFRGLHEVYWQEVMRFSVARNGRRR
jgi:hypothetical protein